MAPWVLGVRRSRLKKGIQPVTRPPSAKPLLGRRCVRHCNTQQATFFCIIARSVHYNTQPCTQRTTLRPTRNVACTAQQKMQRMPRVIAAFRSTLQMTTDRCATGNVASSRRRATRNVLHLQPAQCLFVCDCSPKPIQRCV
jgi:hypothetical protein